MRKNKIYYKAVIFGIIGVFMSLVFFIHIRTLKRIRDNGQIIKVPIESFSPIKKGYIAYINIQGQNLSTGSIDRDKYKVGDFISVYYLPNEYCTVQITRPYYYNYYYGCNSLFLLGSVYLTIAGLMGKGRPKNEE